MSEIHMSVEEKRRLFFKICVTICAILFIAVVVKIVYFVISSKTDNNSNGVVATMENGTIETDDGNVYVPKKSIQTYLFMGIDNMGKVEKATDYGQQGRCDTIMLVVRDLSTGTFKTLNLNRNLLVEQDSLDLEGNYLGTSTSILALAHENGDGLESSCENVVKAVSNFLGGQKIDGYMAINMGAISKVNNLAGGVTVTIEDDFSKVDPTMVMGETITLSDEQAMTFVRGRFDVGDETNESRMRRQSAYMENLKIQFRHKCTEDNQFPITLYEGIGDYMVTNIKDSTFSKIAYLMLQDRDEGEVTIEGESRVNDMDYMEMQADPDSVQSAIIDLFYREKY